LVEDWCSSFVFGDFCVVVNSNDKFVAKSFGLSKSICVSEVNHIVTTIKDEKKFSVITKALKLETTRDTLRLCMQTNEILFSLLYFLAWRVALLLFIIFKRYTSRRKFTPESPSSAPASEENSFVTISEAHRALELHHSRCSTSRHRVFRFHFRTHGNYQPPVYQVFIEKNCE
jgi:hypothetical protein